MQTRIILLLSLLITMSCDESTYEKPEINTVLNPQPFHLVQLEDMFWAPRIETQAQVLLPFAFEKTIPAVENLRKTANYLAGDSSALPFPHRYISSDLYKVMEGASYLLKMKPDPSLELKMDSIISIIEKAQRDDGYLYVAHITGVSKDHSPWGGGGMGDHPYSWVVHSHELYNMGHMYEAAIAYYQATGKNQWLQIAEKNAQHINRVFFEGDSLYNQGIPVMQAPGHQELELALTKLFRVTGDSLYLEMAKKFLEIRGVTYIPEGDQYLKPTYAQQHLPVALQRKAVGHAVRAGYMYSSMAEVDALTELETYSEALDSIWHDIVDRKMHITGGLGAMHGIEGFGEPYELPNAEAYNETCAAVSNVFFNYRMFLKYRDAKFIDVAEVSLYNNALAGVNLDGNRFFYVNPLEADGLSNFNHGEPGRSPWFNTACCPSNIARLIPQVSGMMYASDDQNIFVTLYGANSTTIPMEGYDVGIKQKTDYPNNGNILLELHPSKTSRFSLKLRIPTWTSNKLVPGDLYTYTAPTEEVVTILVNGVSAPLNIEKGFATINREWKENDRVEVNLPMVVHLNQSHEAISYNRAKLAASRGPMVYCSEGVDNENLDEKLSSNIDLHTDLLGINKTHNVISIIAGNGLTLIPYYAWNNRGNSTMKVWIDTIDE